MIVELRFCMNSAQATMTAVRRVWLDTRDGEREGRSPTWEQCRARRIRGKVPRRARTTALPLQQREGPAAFMGCLRDAGVPVVVAARIPAFNETRAAQRREVTALSRPGRRSGSKPCRPTCQSWRAGGNGGRNSRGPTQAVRRPPNRSVVCAEGAYSSVSSSFAWTGPLSRPFAAGSRSTSSITAISAASPYRMPAFSTRV